MTGARQVRCLRPAKAALAAASPKDQIAAAVEQARRSISHELAEIRDREQGLAAADFVGDGHHATRAQ